VAQIRQMTIGNAISLAISMMTEKDFWDMFHKKHNSRYYYGKKKTKEKIKEKNKKQKDNTFKRKVPGK
jgi:hypothetical protein